MVALVKVRVTIHMVHEFKVKWIQLTKLSNRQQGTGATILREKMEFDDFYLAYLVDPTGIGIGLIQHKNNA